MSKLENLTQEQEAALSNIETVAKQIAAQQREFEAAQRRAERPVLGLRHQQAIDIDDLTYDTEMQIYRGRMEHLNAMVKEAQGVGLNFNYLLGYVRECGVKFSEE